MLTHDELKTLIESSQHCQRNWDLEKQIPKDDLELLIYAVANCPSKQNYAFYDCYFVLDREKIESIHANTVGFGLTDGTITTNSQTLANLLIIFCPVMTHEYKMRGPVKNMEFARDSDTNMAIGIAAGYANLLGHMLGFKTGFCKCFNGFKVQEIINSKTPASLILGIGYNNLERNRLEHHLTNQIFPSKTKQTIDIKIL